MAAANYNFSIEKGTSFTIAFEYRNSDQVPINLTNWCARLRYIDDIGNIVSYETNTVNEDYSFTLDATAGKVILKLPAIKTAAIQWNSAKYDLELQEPSDLYSSSLDENKKVYRILEGTISTIAKNIQTYTPFGCTADEVNPCRTC
jgi:hypothetical protein